MELLFGLNPMTEKIIIQSHQIDSFIDGLITEDAVTYDIVKAAIIKLENCYVRQSEELIKLIDCSFRASLYELCYIWIIELKLPYEYRTQKHFPIECIKDSVIRYSERAKEYVFKILDDRLHLDGYAARKAIFERQCAEFFLSQADEVKKTIAAAVRKRNNRRAKERKKMRE